MYNRKFSDARNLAATFVWGQNFKEGKYTNAYLFEADYSFGKNAVFGRIEQAQKDGHELVIPPDDPLHEGTYSVGAYSIGYIRDVVQNKGLDVGVGAKFTANTNPSELVPIYGGTTHGGWQMFVRFRPSKAEH